MSERQVLTLPEAAEMLGVSRRTVERLVARGEPVIPGVEAFKVGSQWRVSRRLLEQHLYGQKAGVA